MFGIQAKETLLFESMYEFKRGDIGHMLMENFPMMHRV